jgi:hypothetical protein
VGELAEAKTRRKGGTVAYFLNGGHERKGEKGCPQQAETVPGTCLGVGGDAGRIVVRSTSDQAGSKIT